MIQLSFERTAKLKPQIVLVFGSGLIGSSIIAALQRMGHCLDKLDIDWSWPRPTNMETQAVERAVQQRLNNRPSSHLTIVWAAGKSGFGSSEEDMSLEDKAFCSVRKLARKLAKYSDGATSSFIHISSAGGLFEGQIGCDRGTLPRPIRAYGHGKLKQEVALAGEADLGLRLIVRPSSVYGYVPGGRVGLISALIAAGLQNQLVSIFGALTTQRDYIFAPDIGRFIAQRVFSESPKSTDLETLLLASGRPASVFEIINTVEDVVQVPLYLKINANPDNALDNTFRPSALPPGFLPTPLRQAIEQTKSAMEAHSFGK